VVVAIATWMARKRPPLQVAVWMGAVALGCRCLFDPVLCPYYMVPALALALVVAASRDQRRLWLASAVAAATVWASYRSAGEWGYYLPVVGGLALTWLVSLPARARVPETAPVPESAGRPAGIEAPVFVPVIGAQTPVGAGVPA
jgi:hypothetical protein